MILAAVNILRLQRLIYIEGLMYIQCKLTFLACTQGNDRKHGPAVHFFLERLTFDTIGEVERVGLL